MNTDGTGFHTCKECHKTKSLWNHTTTDHKEGEQLEDQRNVVSSSCNSGDGTDQRVQFLMFMMMIWCLLHLIPHLLSMFCHLPHKMLPLASRTNTRIKINEIFCFHLSKCFFFDSEFVSVDDWEQNGLYMAMYTACINSDQYTQFWFV